MTHAQDIASAKVVAAHGDLDRDRRYRCLNPMCQARVTLRVSIYGLMVPYFAHVRGEGAKTGCDLYLAGHGYGYASAYRREDEREQAEHIGFELALKGPRHLDWQLEIRLPRSDSETGTVKLRLGLNAFHEVRVSAMKDEARRFDIIPCNDEIGVVDISEVNEQYLDRLQPRTMKINSGMIKAFHSSGLGHRYRSVGRSLYWGTQYYFVWKARPEIDFPLALEKRLIAERNGWNCALVTMPRDGSDTIKKWLSQHLELETEGRKANLTLVYPARWNRNPRGDISANCGSTILVSVHRNALESLRDALVVESSTGVHRLNVNARNHVMMLISRDPSVERFLYIRFGVEPGYLIDCDQEVAVGEPVCVSIRTISRSGATSDISLQSPLASKALKMVRSGALSRVELFSSGSVKGTLKWRTGDVNHWDTLEIEHTSTGFSRLHESVHRKLNSILRQRDITVVIDFKAFGFQVIAASASDPDHSLPAQLLKQVLFLTSSAEQPPLRALDRTANSLEVQHHIAHLRIDACSKCCGLTFCVSSREEVAQSMHPDNHPLKYSQEARKRIAGLTAAQVNSFLTGISRGRITPWLVALPKIDGFRPNSPGATIEQRKRLISRLTSNEARLSHETDWHVLQHLWIAWTDENFRDLQLPTTVQSIEDGEEVEGLDNTTWILKTCNEMIGERKATRELLSTFFLFSPFAGSQAINAVIAAAPASNELERMKFIDSLPEALSHLEGRLQELASQDKAGDHVDQSLEEVTARLGELTSLVSSLSSEASTMQKSIGSGADEANGTRERVGVSETRLAAIEERLLDLELRVQLHHDEHIAAIESTCVAIAELTQVASTARLDDVTSVSERKLSDLLDRLSSAEVTSKVAVSDLQDMLLTTVDRVDIIARKFEEGDLGSPNQAGFVAHHTTAWAEVTSGGATTDLGEFRSWVALRDAMQQNLKQIGLNSESAIAVANEVTTGIANAQLVTFAGSLRTVVAMACSSTFTHTKRVFVVPFGFVRVIELPPRGHETPVLLLSGVNRSAFEIYGDSVTVGLGEDPTRPLGTNPPVLLATFLDGAGTLPLSESYADLGPIVETDALAYHRTHDEPARFLGGLFDRETISVERAASDLDDLEELLTVPRLLRPVGSALYEKTYFAAASFLLETLKAPRSSAAASLVASWVIPRLRCGAMSVKNLKDALTSSPLADMLSDARIKRALLRVGP